MKTLSTKSAKNLSALAAAVATAWAAPVLAAGSSASDPHWLEVGTSFTVTSEGGFVGHQAEWSHSAPDQGALTFAAPSSTFDANRTATVTATAAKETPEGAFQIFAVEADLNNLKGTGEWVQIMQSRDNSNITFSPEPSVTDPFGGSNHSHTIDFNAEQNLVLSGLLPNSPVSNVKLVLDDGTEINSTAATLTVDADGNLSIPFPKIVDTAANTATLKFDFYKNLKDQAAGTTTAFTNTDSHPLDIMRYALALDGSTSGFEPDTAYSYTLSGGRDAASYRYAVYPTSNGSVLETPLKNFVTQKFSGAGGNIDFSISLNTLLKFSNVDGIRLIAQSLATDQPDNSALNDLDGTYLDIKLADHTLSSDTLSVAITLQGGGDHADLVSPVVAMITDGGTGDEDGAKDGHIKAKFSAIDGRNYQDNLTVGVDIGYLKTGTVESTYQLRNIKLPNYQLSVSYTLSGN